MINQKLNRHKGNVLPACKNSKQPYFESLLKGLTNKE